LGYEAGKIYKWLETIKALAPDSPILVVATHSKDRGADLPKGDIENKYPEKVHFFEVDNTQVSGQTRKIISAADVGARSEFCIRLDIR